MDTLRRSIHALGAQRALVFMNFQQRLKDTGEGAREACPMRGDLGIVPEGHR